MNRCWNYSDWVPTSPTWGLEKYSLSYISICSLLFSMGILRSSEIFTMLLTYISFFFWMASIGSPRNIHCALNLYNLLFLDCECSRYWGSRRNFGIIYYLIHVEAPKSSNTSFSRHEKQERVCRYIQSVPKVIYQKKNLYISTVFGPNELIFSPDNKGGFQVLIHERKVQ